MPNSPNIARRFHIKLQRSSSFRLALAFAVLLLVSIIIAIYYVRVSADTRRRNEVRSIVATDIRGLEDVYHLQGIEGVASVIERRLKNPDKGIIYVLEDEIGHVVLGNLSYMPEEKQRILEFTISDEQSDESGLPSGTDYDIIGSRHSLPNGYTILAARNMSETRVFSAAIDYVAWGLFSVILLISAAAFYIGDRVVYRINLIASTAEQIIRTSDLSTRIPIPNNWDDLSVLARLLNELLDKLERSVSAVRQVSDNIAHDLRTPLTRMKNKLEHLHERAIKEELPIMECSEQLIGDADHILQTFSSLLSISNLESGKWQAAFEPISLSELLEDIVEFYEPLASDKGQMLHASLMPCTVMGDKHLLFQAISNMVDNAIKYAPEQSDIHLKLMKHADAVELRVIDSGQGVASEEYERIFDRFYRSDASRSKQGNGLGLSLVKAIAKAHKGNVSAGKERGGFALMLSLPAQQV
jgi:signal transduction histidine kinase